MVLVTAPAVIVFGALTLLMLRSRMMRPLEMVVAALFGFFLSSTGLGKALSTFLVALFNIHTGGGAHSLPLGPWPDGTGWPL